MNWLMVVFDFADAVLQIGSRGGGGGHELGVRTCVCVCVCVCVCSP